MNEDELHRLYVVDGLTMQQIAEMLNVSVGTVYNNIHAFNIPVRTLKQCADIRKKKGWKYPDDARERIGKAHKGKVLSQETKEKISKAHKKGGVGHKKVRGDGYVAIYFPDHPKSTKSGYVMEHDLIMECIIGRHLKENECVHHINEIKSDNRKENLMLMTKSEHMSYHCKKRHAKNRKDDDLSI